MEDQTATPMQPLLRQPLTFKGVFGIAWMLYRRSFKGLVPLCMLLVGLLLLLIVTPLIFAIVNISQSAISGNVMSVEAGIFFPILILIIWLLMLVYFFVVAPMLMATMHMEMDQCVEGHPGRFRDLWRYALPIGLKRFYTTFLALIVIQLAVSFALSIVSGIASAMFVIPSLISFSFGQSGIMNTELIPTGVSLLFSAISLIASAVFAACYMFVYPVAVHEGRRAFKAVSRAFQLAIRRFGRVLLANLVLMLSLYIAFALIALVIIWPLQSLQTVNSDALIVIVLPILFGLMMLFMVLYMPYNAALSTALYIDSAARVPPKAEPQYPVYSRYGQPADAPAQQQPPQLPYTSANGQPADAPAPLPKSKAEDSPDE